MRFWEKGTQVKCQATSRFQEDQQRLNLQKNADGLYECRGRIQGDYPIYRPDDALFSKKLVMHVHLQTLHGGSHEAEYVQSNRKRSPTLA